MNNEIIFFQHFDGPYFPTLRLIHKCKLFLTLSCIDIFIYFLFLLFLTHCFVIFIDPDMLPRLQVDRGAIKFVMAGANIMCPGLTSPGARMDVSLPANAIVAIYAENKENALAVGLTKMSTEDMYVSFLFNCLD